MKQEYALPARLRLLVVDDFPLVRLGIRSLVGSVVAELEFMGAGSGQEARERVAEGRPDLVVVDLVLRDESGLDLVRHLRSEGMGAPVLVLSMFSETAFAERALRAGASGYLMKKVEGEVLLEAMARVLAGEVHLSPEVARRIAGRLTTGPGSALSLPELLTARELEVWRHLGSGRSTRTIASLLGVSPKTVETHCYNIRRKVGLGSMTELVHAATRWLHGITD